MAFLNSIDSAPVNWLLQIHWAMEWKRLPNWSIDKLTSPCSIVWFVLGGMKSVRLDDTDYELKDGDLAIIPPNASITVRQMPNQSPQLHHLAVGLTIQWGSHHLFEQYKFPRVTQIEDTAARIALVDCWQRLVAETELLEGDELRTIRLHELGYRLLDLLIGLLRKERTLPQQTIDPRVQRACQYMRLQFFVNPSLADVARSVYISESHLRLLFRKTLGLSPMDYMRQVRMERAREMLSATNRSLKEISAMLGFTEPGRFSREFRRMEGIPPFEYRRRWKLL